MKTQTWRIRKRLRRAIQKIAEPIADRENLEDLSVQRGRVKRGACQAHDERADLSEKGRYIDVNLAILCG